MTRAAALPQLRSKPSRSAAVRRLPRQEQYDAESEADDLPWLVNCAAPVPMDDGTMRVCHKCKHCIELARTIYAGRVSMEAADCVAAGGKVFFLTLTIGGDDHADPANPRKVTRVAPKARQLDRSLPLKFLGKLYRYGRRKRIDFSRRYAGCGEYGTEKGRAHYHVILFCRGQNIPEWLTSLQGVNKTVSDWWPHGFMHVMPFEFDRAAYVAKYIYEVPDKASSCKPVRFQSALLGAEYVFRYVDQVVAAGVTLHDMLIPVAGNYKKLRLPGWPVSNTLKKYPIRSLTLERACSRYEVGMIARIYGADGLRRHEEMRRNRETGTLLPSQFVSEGFCKFYLDARDRRCVKHHSATDGVLSFKTLWNGEVQEMPSAFLGKRRLEASANSARGVAERVYRGGLRRRASRVVYAFGTRKICQRVGLQGVHLLRRKMRDRALRAVYKRIDRGGILWRDKLYQVGYDLAYNCFISDGNGDPWIFGGASSDDARESMRRIPFLAGLPAESAIIQRLYGLWFAARAASDRYFGPCSDADEVREKEAIATACEPPSAPFSGNARVYVAPEQLTEEQRQDPVRIANEKKRKAGIAVQAAVPDVEQWARGLRSRYPSAAVTVALADPSDMLTGDALGIAVLRAVVGDDIDRDISGGWAEKLRQGRVRMARRARLRRLAVPRLRKKALLDYLMPP